MVSLFIANNIEKGLRLCASPEQRFLPGYLTRPEDRRRDFASGVDGEGGGMNSRGVRRRNQALKTSRLARYSRLESLIRGFVDS